MSGDSATKICSHGTIPLLKEEILQGSFNQGDNLDISAMLFLIKCSHQPHVAGINILIF
jgi:hypothetical protein